MISTVGKQMSTKQGRTREYGFNAKGCNRNSKVEGCFDFFGIFASDDHTVVLGSQLWGTDFFGPSSAGRKWVVLMWEGRDCVEFLSVVFCFSFLSKQAGGGTASRAGSVESQQQPLRVLFTCVRDGSDNFEEGRLFS
jgi:hypothetical protein